ncbi:hypothetical protein HYFRA_00013126 [Hymenoscyphus fraxineus]|uniref:RNA helicase n=1 Tax=Hymenoscyphus fraxineus TaxID=746836 RepID=A0A9N9PMN8_9HELO|nr:hypothetical protein HYFRA_00013126 [Hymenoscyphus fraxineus]
MSGNASEGAEKAPSLADRITRPATSSWADEVSSPTGATPTKDTPSPLPAAQVDGTATILGGSGMMEDDDDGPIDLYYSDQQKQRGLDNQDRRIIKTWEDLGLNPLLLKGLYSMSFLRPSNIQSQALPHLLLENPPPNMIGQSRSGTGKTGTFAITMLARLDFSKPNIPQAMCIAPTRELAIQIIGVIRTMGQYFVGQETLTLHSAVSPDPKDPNSPPPHRGPVNAMVVVGTPGTIEGLIKQRQLNTSQLRIVVLDEADQMLSSQGHGDSSLRIKRFTPPTAQVLLFSATFPENVNKFASFFCPDPMRLELKVEELTVKGIKQMFVDCDSQSGRDGQYETLVQLYGLTTIGQSIIFVKTRATADAIERKLSEADHQVLKLHGGMLGSERDNAIQRFRNGEFKVLITTNVFARGIDISAISLVINYDVPMKRLSPNGRDEVPDFETYLHRIGRTGRFGRTGLAISFVFDKPSFDALSAIGQYFGVEMTRLDLDDLDGAERLVKDIINKNLKENQKAVSG